MSESYIPLISGLVGALIGSLSSIVTIVIQSRYQRNRDLTRLATESAMHEFAHHLELAKTRKGVTTRMPPLSLYVRYHYRFLSLLEAGDLSADHLKLLSEDQKRFREALEEIHNQRGDVNA